MMALHLYMGVLVRHPHDDHGVVHLRAPSCFACVRAGAQRQIYGRGNCTPICRHDVRASAADTRARPGCTGIAPRSCARVWSLITPATGKLLVAPYDQHRTRTCSRLPRVCFPLCFAVRPGCVDAGPFVMARSSISVWTCFIPSPLCNAARQRYCLGHEDIQ